MIQLPLAPAHAAALLAQLVLRRLGGEGYRALAGDFDESKHPRDGTGKFTESGSDVPVMVKKKAAPATKDQIAEAVKMKAAGASYAEIHAKTGLNPKQAATIVHKFKKAEKAIKAQLGGPQKATAADVAKAGANLDPYKETATTYVSPSGKVMDKATGNVVANPTPEQTGSKVSASGDIVNAKGEKFAWQEKTAANSSGAKANLGKWAYFDEKGKQVSAPAAKDAHAEAAKTIHQGKGPDWAPAPPPPTPEAKLGAVEKGVGGGSGLWPIPDDANRVIGKNYPIEVAMHGQKWRAGLTTAERNAIEAYTSSGYAHINSALRKSPDAPLEEGAKHIASALDKAPSPPPPDLVWRGVGTKGAGAFAAKLEAGDLIRMDGFQSTSISPGFAGTWGGGGPDHVLFEIRPVKGAYIQPMNSYASEREYLLPHGAKYVVHAVTHAPINGAQRKVIQLEMQKQ